MMIGTSIGILWVCAVTTQVAGGGNPGVVQGSLGESFVDGYSFVSGESPGTCTIVDWSNERVSFVKGPPTFFFRALVPGPERTPYLVSLMPPSTDVALIDTRSLEMQLIRFELPKDIEFRPPSLLGVDKHGVLYFRFVSRVILSPTRGWIKDLHICTVTIKPRLAVETIFTIRDNDNGDARAIVEGPARACTIYQWNESELEIVENGRSIAKVEFGQHVGLTCEDMNQGRLLGECQRIALPMSGRITILSAKDLAIEWQCPTAKLMKYQFSRDGTRLVTNADGCSVFSLDTRCVHRLAGIHEAENIREFAFCGNDVVLRVQSGDLLHVKIDDGNPRLREQTRAHADEVKDKPAKELVNVEHRLSLVTHGIRVTQEPIK